MTEAYTKTVEHMSTLESMLGGSQRVAYAGLVALVAELEFCNWDGARALPTTVALSLGMSTDEVAMIASLSAPASALRPADLAVTLRAEPEATRHAVVAHLFVILLCRAVNRSYDARARALLFRVAELIEVPRVSVCTIERDVLNQISHSPLSSDTDKTTAIADSGASGNSTSTAKKVLYVALSTVAGGVAIGATAGLAGPAVAGALISAHAAHCGISIGTIGMLATSGAVTAGGVSNYKLSSTPHKIADVGIVPVHSDSEKLSSNSSTAHTPPPQANTILGIPGLLDNAAPVGLSSRTSVFTCIPNYSQGSLQTLNYEVETLQQLNSSAVLIAALLQDFKKANMGTLPPKLYRLLKKPFSATFPKAQQIAALLCASIESRSIAAPLTLVGLGVGARVAFEVLVELGKRKMTGIVDCAVLVGAPVQCGTNATPANAAGGGWTLARSAVAGLFINAYCTKDEVLRMLFDDGGTSGKRLNIAGVEPVQIDGIRNVCVDDFVNSHADYADASAVAAVLRECGFGVEELQDALRDEKHHANLMDAQARYASELEALRAGKYEENKGGVWRWIGGK
ncbi:hypothetical protein HDU83_007377 [Entophlyctis luteolus]|nr:hypothetical protein HDU83_007377 [Entophlyctis luteolus]